MASAEQKIFMTCAYEDAMYMKAERIINTSSELLEELKNTGFAAIYVEETNKTYKLDFETELQEKMDFEIVLPIMKELFLYQDKPLLRLQSLRKLDDYLSTTIEDACSNLANEIEGDR